MLWMSSWLHNVKPGWYWMHKKISWVHRVKPGWYSMHEKIIMMVSLLSLSFRALGPIWCPYSCGLGTCTCCPYIWDPGIALFLYLGTPIWCPCIWDPTVKPGWHWMYDQHRNKWSAFLWFCVNTCTEIIPCCKRWWMLCPSWNKWW